MELVLVEVKKVTKDEVFSSEDYDDHVTIDGKMLEESYDDTHTDHPPEDGKIYSGNSIALNDFFLFYVGGSVVINQIGYNSKTSRLGSGMQWELEAIGLEAWTESVKFDEVQRACEAMLEPNDIKPSLSGFTKVHINGKADAFEIPCLMHYETWGSGEDFEGQMVWGGLLDVSSLKVI